MNVFRPGGATPDPVKTDSQKSLIVTVTFQHGLKEVSALKSERFCHGDTITNPFNTDSLKLAIAMVPI